MWSISFPVISVGDETVGIVPRLSSLGTKLDREHNTCIMSALATIILQLNDTKRHNSANYLERAVQECGLLKVSVDIGNFLYIVT